MFADHQAKVLKRYQQLKAIGPLSTNLKIPTPARLRNECERLIYSRFSKDDQEILSSYFGEQADRAGYVTAISNFDIDLFRPLESFMKGKVKKPDVKHVELLAWLIDYTPRPHRVGDPYEVSANKLGSDVVGEETENKNDYLSEKKIDNEAEKSDFLEQEPRQSYWLLSAVVVGILAVLGLTGYYYFDRGEVGDTEHCMYWTGDHYETIACDKKPDDTTAMVIGLDSNKLVHFKRITRADTLTGASVGKVWYIKINDEVEYYTSPGEPPAHPGRRLLPLTPRILNVHSRHAG